MLRLSVLLSVLAMLAVSAVVAQDVVAPEAEAAPEVAAPEAEAEPEAEAAPEAEEKGDEKKKCECDREDVKCPSFNAEDFGKLRKCKKEAKEEPKAEENECPCGYEMNECGKCVKKTHEDEPTAGTAKVAKADEKDGKCPGYYEAGGGADPEARERRDAELEAIKAVKAKKAAAQAELQAELEAELERSRVRGYRVVGGGEAAAGEAPAPVRAEEAAEHVEVLPAVSKEGEVVDVEEEEAKCGEKKEKTCEEKECEAIAEKKEAQEKCEAAKVEENMLLKEASYEKRKTDGMRYVESAQNVADAAAAAHKAYMAKAKEADEARQV